jgi:hypothetical protein
MQKKIKITENQLKKIVNTLNEQKFEDRTVLRHLYVLLGDALNIIKGSGDTAEGIALIKGSLELLYIHQGNLNTKISDEKIDEILNEFRDGNEMNEQLDMPEDPGMEIKVGMAVMSHLSDIQEMAVGDGVNDRINFVKKLVMKYPDMNQTVSTTDLDTIYDEMLGGGKPDMNDDVKNIDDKPFPDGYDFSMNESVEKIKKQFNRFL